MVIFTSNSRRLQILCWEIVNPRISQSEEFVTEFPCFHQICESPAHRLVQLLWPINKYIGKYISFPIYFCRHWATTLKLSTFINRWFLMSSLQSSIEEEDESHIWLGIDNLQMGIFFTLVMSDRYRLCLDSERKQPTFQKIACCSSWSLLPIDN